MADESKPIEVSAYEADKSVGNLIRLLEAGRTALAVLRDKQTLDGVVADLTRQADDLRSQIQKLREQADGIRAEVPKAREAVEAAMQAERNRIAADLERAKREVAAVKAEREQEQTRRSAEEGRHRQRVAEMEKELADQKATLLSEIEQVKRDGQEVRNRIGAETERAQAALDAILDEHRAIVTRLQAAGQVAAASAR